MVGDNGFLRSLGAVSAERLAEFLRPVELANGQVLSLAGETVEWVYFPETCLLSLILATADGKAIETSMVGRESAAGLFEVFGSGRTQVEWVVQVDGRALRASAAQCRSVIQADTAFSAVAWKAAELQMFESRQSAFCQAMHPVEARFPRWLLESLDRSGGRNPLPLKQEFIAAMLGVQRTTVSAIASQAQKDGLISYTRGQINVLDEAGLEHRACECHRLVKAERRRLGFA